MLSFDSGYMTGSNVSETDIAELLKHLISSGAVDGHVKGKAYVPGVFTRLQRSCLEDFYRENGYIAYSRARKLKVCGRLVITGLVFIMGYLQLFRTR